MSIILKSIFVAFLKKKIQIQRNRAELNEVRKARKKFKKSITYLCVFKIRAFDQIIGVHLDFTNKFDNIKHHSSHLNIGSKQQRSRIYIVL